MPVRVISWNIKNFARNHLATNQAIIMRRLYDGGERLCDVFVIIEPFVKNVKKVGDVVVKGAGCEGLMDLFYLLRAKDPLWKVVPPRGSCCGTKSDFVAMLYHSGVVTFTGPENMLLVPAATAGVVGGVQAWAAGAAGPVPKVKFMNGGKEINFVGRRPAMAAFNGAKYLESRTYTITIAALAPPVVPRGVVPLAITTTQLPVGAPGEAYDFTLQAEGVAGTPAWTVSAGGPLPAGLNLDGATGRLHGNTAFTGTQNVRFQLEVTPLLGAKGPPVNQALTLDFDEALRLRSPAVLADGVVGTAYDVQVDACGGTIPRLYVLNLKTGESLPPGLSVSGTGRIQGNPTTAGVYTFTVDTSDTPSQAFNLMGLHAPPDGGDNYPKNANSTAITNVAKINEIKGGTASAVCGDFNCCPLACCNTANTKQRTALNAVGAHLTHRDFNERTSLKQPGSAVYNDYRSEYFDHIFTRNFAAVPAFGLLNLITSDPNWGAAQAQAIAGNTNNFDVLFARYSWPGGASDHLPVHFTLSF